MFPLKQRKIGGFKFGQKTWYTEHHLGTDYSAKTGTEIFAPFDGEVISQVNGKQGGLTVHYRPKHDDVVMRFMHNSKFLKKGKVKEGEVIALSGNTGEATTAPHVHLDISKHSVDIKNFNNFIDPEKYDWNYKKAEKAPQVVQKIEVPVTPEVILTKQDSPILEPSEALPSVVIEVDPPVVKPWYLGLLELIFKLIKK